MAKSKLHQEVLHRFLEALKAEENFDNQIAEELHNVLLSDKKIKSDDLTSIFQKEDDAK